MASERSELVSHVATMADNHFVQSNNGQPKRKMKRRTSKEVILVAYHEAAHAVVAYKVFHNQNWVPVRNISIKADNNSDGHCTICETEIDARVLVAGSLAEANVLRLLHQPRDEIILTTARGAKDDFANLTDKELSIAADIASDIILSNWSLIEKIATQLRKNRYIGASSMHRILSECR
jgi:ATP-dependent Zn protease